MSGVVDFDDVAPSVTITRVTVKKRPQRNYILQIYLSAKDGNSGAPVSYRVELRDGTRVLASKKGNVTDGKVSPTLRVSPPGGVRSVALAVVVSDAVGNERTVVRSVRLP